MRKPSVGPRQGEKLVRLAYDLEAMAARMRMVEGFEDEAGGVKELSSLTGKVGRSILDKTGRNSEAAGERNNHGNLGYIQ